jgi:hypothetical protein
MVMNYYYYDTQENHEIDEAELVRLYRRRRGGEKNRRPRPNILRLMLWIRNFSFVCVGLAMVADYCFGHTTLAVILCLVAIFNGVVVLTILLLNGPEPYPSTRLKNIKNKLYSYF